MTAQVVSEQALKWFRNTQFTETWAQRTLRFYVEDNPKSCNARLYLAWLAMQQGMVCNESPRKHRTVTPTDPTNPTDRRPVGSSDVTLGFRSHGANKT
jgi:hypothetical protein